MKQTNRSLKNYNTMKVDANAEIFYILNDKSELTDICSSNIYKNILVIGSGSNILFTKDIEGLVIKNQILGIEVLHDDNSTVQVKVGAGVEWHNFVMQAVNNNWAGIENLALIPGTVGAAPVQNIGAYGQEIKDVVLNLEAFEISTLQTVSFSNSDCKFSYRNSIFKQEAKNKFIITSVTFELKKNFQPNFSYPALVNAFKSKRISEPTIKQIAETVIEIRQSKLPDHSVLSNCGSFFTNPFLDQTEFEKFIVKHTSTPFFKFGEGFKLSAGWLIEQCGWKGKKLGNMGCYKDHALIIVNYGGATGKEIFEFSQKIIKSVYEKFGITLNYEVDII
jgi:UDP-N-acetylmuramate dehydrogenase